MTLNMLAANEIGATLALVYGAEQPPKPKAGGSKATVASNVAKAAKAAKTAAMPATTPDAARALVAPTCGLPTSAPTDPFYVTTAINYTNGAPHIGQAFAASA